MNDSMQAGVAAKLCSKADDLLRQNKPLDALAAFDQALKADRNYPRAIIGTTLVVERLAITRYSQHLDRLILHCLQSPHGNSEALTNPAGQLLQLKYGLPDNEFQTENVVLAESELERVCKDVLLITYLVATINRNLPLESLLKSFRTGIRRIA